MKEQTDDERAGDDERANRRRQSRGAMKEQTDDDRARGWCQSKSTTEQDDHSYMSVAMSRKDER